MHISSKNVYKKVLFKIYRNFSIIFCIVLLTVDICGPQNSTEDLCVLSKIFITDIKKITVNRTY